MIRSTCTPFVDYGCVSPNNTIWTKNGCRGWFTCVEGVGFSEVHCGDHNVTSGVNCSCIEPTLLATRPHLHERLQASAHSATTNFVKLLETSAAHNSSAPLPTSSCANGVARASSAAGSSRPYVAIVLSGRLRNPIRVSSPSIAGPDRWHHWPLMARHVVDALARDAHVATFACIGEDDAPPPRDVARGLHIVRVVRGGANVTNAEFRVPHAPSGTLASMKAQSNRWGVGFGLAMAYEKAELKAEFTFFLRMRPDLLWFGDIPPLASYSDRAISVRARSLHGGHSRSVRTTLEHMSIIQMGCEKNHDCNSNTRRPCLVPDDTFAIVPRTLAPSYFLFQPLPPLPPLPPRDCERPFYSDWGNSTECKSCLKCQRIFCQEFGFAQQWTALGIPMELRGFRARIYVEEDYLAKNLCSRYGERCGDLFQNAHHDIPLHC